MEEFEDIIKVMRGLQQIEDNLCRLHKEGLLADKFDIDCICEQIETLKEEVRDIAGFLAEEIAMRE